MLHFASAHLAANAVNLFIMETVRRNYLEEHRGIVTAELVPKDGRLPLPSGPGLGIELAPEMFKRPDVTVDLFTT